MNPAEPHPSVRTISRLDLLAKDWRWPFADERRAEIDAYFARLRETKPQLWNGRVLLAREPMFSEDALSASYFETDFASFLAWRDWGFPDRTVFNSFGMGALRGSDGAFLLGEMSAHTANAGRVYFPSGTPDPKDLRHNRVDLEASVEREVMEETGLQSSDYDAAPGWNCVLSGRALALIRVLQCSQPADFLCRKIETHLATQPEPELARMHIVRSMDDLTPGMPEFVALFLAEQFHGRGSPSLARPRGGL